MRQHEKIGNNQSSYCDRYKYPRTKQLRMHHACHQSSPCSPGSTNVGHESTQACSTLDGLGICNLKVFADAKPSIQLLLQVLDA